MFENIVMIVKNVQLQLFLFDYDNNHLFAQLYDINYFYIVQIICTQLYDIKYSHLILIIYTQLYGFKQLFLFNNSRFFAYG